MSDITEKINSLCSNAESLKQCLTDLVTMVRTQAEAIECLESSKKELIQQHNEEIEELNFQLTENDKVLSEVIVENTSLHSSIAHLRNCINISDDQLKKQCKSVMSLTSSNSGLHEENSQFKLQLTKKENELKEVLVSNQILISKVKHQEEDITLNNKLRESLHNLVFGPYNKDKELKAREGEIEQLRLKLTETRQKLRDESKKYDELLKSSRKPGVKGGDDLSDQPIEESETMSSSNKDSESQEDEIIEDNNKKKLMNENPSLHTSAQEGRKAIKRKGKNDGGPVSKIGG